MKKVDKYKEIRESCENHLFTFARVVEPNMCYGDIHEEVMNWLQYDSGDNSLVLLPRDHLKSRIAAVLCSWLITRDPAISILYISSTSTLAEKQLRSIKNILTSDIYRRLWPGMVKKEKGQREVWNNNEICVDHPKRSEAGVRDSTVFTAGLTTTTTGLHCNVIIKDDVVEPDNAYTITGREKVSRACSQLASILTTGGKEYVVGTHYHPKDHYFDLKGMTIEEFDSDYNVVGSKPVYGVKEEVVETEGVFLWPRQKSSHEDKSYGFDMHELAMKKVKYTDKTQFFAQYYNNPNDIETQNLSRENFQYFKSEHIKHEGHWKYKNRRLNVYAAMDFASSIKEAADYSCIVVIGVDYHGHIFVLDIDRFKTDKMEKFFQAVLKMHEKWRFSWFRPEIASQQGILVEYIKDRAKEVGMSMRIEPARYPPGLGSKEERIYAALVPRYENMEIWHKIGGYTDMLEEELLQNNPKHDDIKDTLAIACSWDKLKKPAPPRGEGQGNVSYLKTHKRFGGVAR